MEFPEFLNNHEEWRFGPVLFQWDRLEIQLVSEVDRPNFPRRIVKICFSKVSSFGWTTLCRMDQILHEAQPVISQLESTSLDAAVPGVRVDEIFLQENWQKYEIAAFDEIVYVLTTEPPTIESLNA